MEAALIVLLDYGHGGPTDRGCTAKGFAEAADSLEVGLLAHQAIVGAGWPVTVLDTRHDDSYRSLEARAVQAAAVHADLVISLHTDWSPDSREYGPMTFRLQPDPLLDLVCTAWLAGIGRPSLTYDPAGHAHVIPMASKEQVFIAEPTDWRRRAWNVLHHHTQPAVLFEQGRCSNSTELAWLKSFESRLCRAEAVRDAVCAALIHRGELVGS